MSSFNDGDVVICGTGQSGTIIQLDGSESWVFLLNGDIWVGAIHQIRFPQDAEDLIACPLNVDRLEKPLVRVDKQRD